MIYNTGETSEELKANYNPEGSVLRQAQCRMLDMLLYLDAVCREQHITYMLKQIFDSSTLQLVEYFTINTLPGK